MALLILLGLIIASRVPVLADVGDVGPLGMAFFVALLLGLPGWCAFYAVRGFFGAIFAPRLPGKRTWLFLSEEERRRRTHP